MQNLCNQHLNDKCYLHFVDEQVDSNLICPIGGGLILEQFTHNECGKSYCKDCIKNYTQNNNNKCPSCTNSFNTEEIIQNKSLFLKKVIQKQPIYCIQRNSGCTWQGTVEQLDNHLQSHKCQHCFNQLKKIKQKNETLQDDQQQKKIRNNKLNPIMGEYNKTLTGHKSQINCLALLGDGKLASGSSDKNIKIWDVKQGECLNTLEDGAEVFSLAFITNDNLASGSWLTIKIWDVKTGECLQTLLGHNYTIYSLALLADGKLASGSSDNTIKIWDVKQGECLKTLKEHKDNVYCLILGSNGNLISGSKDGFIKIWDVKKGKCLQTLKDGGEVFSLTLLGDGKLASASSDIDIKIWDWDKRQYQFYQKLRMHDDKIYSLVLLSNRQLASGSRDLSIKITDEEKQELMITLLGHGYPVYCLALLADGKLASGYDNQIKIWE